MTEPLQRHVQCVSPRGLHRIGYTEWGPRDAPVVLCVHGLTRNGRDFDPLAKALSDRYRVVCPDMIGRGTSDRAADTQLYAMPQYLSDCVTLIARLDVAQVTWLGTSMGGMIGMLMAALPEAPIARLILNDIGPEIDERGLRRIGSNIGGDPHFATFEEGERALRQTTVEFGPHTDAQFRFLSRHYVIRHEGRWQYHYDPEIARALAGALTTPLPALWNVYDAIRCPTHVIRGGDSDLLSVDVARQMTQRGPRASLTEFPGVGHAPTFIADAQIAVVAALLDGTSR